MATMSPLNIKWRVACTVATLCLTPYFVLLFVLGLKSILLKDIFINMGFCAIGFGVTLYLIPIVSRYNLKKDLFGYDINKKGLPAGKTKVPEALGLVAGVVFLVYIIIFQIFQYVNNTVDSAWQQQFISATFAIGFMLGLGFLDDILDLPWKAKIIMPSLPALVLLMAYAGGTTIIIPKPLRWVINFEMLNLGWMYKVFMFLVVIFCSNSINILAGINGLEVGQSIIISSAVMILNVLQIAYGPEEMCQAHVNSLYMMQPFFATSIGLLAFNWYPSSIFVGDTYTYFAGMTLAVVGIHGHFCETLLLFFLPQILNFIYSLPQLLKIIPCPRHRLPRFDKLSGLLNGSKDMNLVNFVLRWLGPCSEKQLCMRILLFQASCCGLTFLLRNLLSGWYK